MALNIVRKKKQTPYQARQESIKQAIAENEILREHLKADHPLLEFEPVRVSESITFWISNKQSGQASIATAAMFNLNSGLSDILQEQQFKSTFMSALQAFLFWETAREVESRQNLLLIEQNGAIQWPAVRVFVERAMQHLPFEIETISQDGTIHFCLHPIEIKSVRAQMSLNMGLTQADYSDAMQHVGHLNANSAFGDHLLMQLTRAILVLPTEKQLEQMQADAEADRPLNVQKHIAEARALLNAQAG